MKIVNKKIITLLCHSFETNEINIPISNEFMKNILEFNLDKFEDYLHKQKVNLPRVDIVIISIISDSYGEELASPLI